MSCSVIVPINLRRFDLSDNPEMESLNLELNANSDYPNLKREIKSVFGITDEDAKVIKIRNKQHALIPMMSLLDSKEDQSPFIIDITNIAVASESRSNLLQDAYLDAVRQKMRSMESRVCQAEVLLPQLQWRRQSHLDHTVNTLSNRVAFLNRRIDELMPVEWKSKMPETIS